MTSSKLNRKTRIGGLQLQLTTHKFLMMYVPWTLKHEWLHLSRKREPHSQILRETALERCLEACLILLHSIPLMRFTPQPWLHHKDDYITLTLQPSNQSSFPNSTKLYCTFSALEVTNFYTTKTNVPKVLIWVHLLSHSDNF